MSKLSNLTNKISDKLGNEVIAELEDESIPTEQPKKYKIPDDEPKEKNTKLTDSLKGVLAKKEKPPREKKVRDPKQKKVKEPKPKKVKEPREKKESFFQKNTNDESGGFMSNKKSNTKMSSNASGALQVLKIKPESNLRGLITPREIGDVEFELIAPTGLNPRQVSGFCNKVERDVYKYIKIIEERDKDVMKLAEENSRLQDELQETKQNSELTQFINSTADETNKLQETIVELRLENRNLQEKVKRLIAQSHDTKLPQIEEKKSASSLPDMGKSLSDDSEKGNVQEKKSSLEDKISKSLVSDIPIKDDFQSLLDEIDN